jgi:hypothetical protein
LLEVALGRVDQLGGDAFAGEVGNRLHRRRFGDAEHPTRFWLSFWLSFWLRVLAWILA